MAPVDLLQLLSKKVGGGGLPSYRTLFFFNCPLSIFSFTPLVLEELPPDLEPEESLGPLEAPSPSPVFRRNYSTSLLLTSHTWNTHFNPFRLPPHTPWEPLLPTEAKFLGAGVGFRPICGGRIFRLFYCMIDFRPGSSWMKD
jgi:hypothetical protein